MTLVRLAGLLAAGLGAGLGGCSVGGAYSDRSEVTTYSISPRPQEGMVREPARPYGRGYSLGQNAMPPEPVYGQTQGPAPGQYSGQYSGQNSGQYKWNGNTTRVQEGAPPVNLTPPARPVVAANGQRTIIVRTGDTLYSLARYHGVTVAALADANGLTSTAVRTGQTLVLP